MKQDLSAEQIMFLLHEMSHRLAAEQLVAKMFVVGGAAISLLYDDRRTTKDVDAYFVPTAKIREIASDVAAGTQLAPDLLNDAVKGFLPGTDEEAETIFASENLTVQVGSPRYLLAMKLYSSRFESDRDDAVLLAQHLKLETEAELFDVVTSYYPPGRVNVKTKYFIQDVIAHLPQNQQTFTVTTDLNHNPDKGLTY